MRKQQIHMGLRDYYSNTFKIEKIITSNKFQMLPESLLSVSPSFLSSNTYKKRLKVQISGVDVKFTKLDKHK